MNILKKFLSDRAKGECFCKLSRGGCERDFTRSRKTADVDYKIVRKIEEEHNFMGRDYAYTNNIVENSDELRKAVSKNSLLIRTTLERITTRFEVIQIILSGSSNLYSSLIYYSKVEYAPDQFTDEMLQTLHCVFFFILSL